MENNLLSVRLWDAEVGSLYWDAEKRQAMFSYAKEFLARNLDIAPLEASINSPVSQRGFAHAGNKDKLYMGLPTFIADSLPDDWGNQLFYQWTASQGIPQRKLTPVDRLAFIGKRGMGALEYEPPVENDYDMFPVEIDSLYHLAEQIFMERQQVRLTTEEAHQLQNLYRIGTSAGGRRPKALIAINRDGGDVRSGQALLPSSYTHYLLKFDQRDAFPFTTVEYAYYLMACEAGIQMMPSRLLTIEGGRHFLTERYDRREGRKIHTQTLAAMNPLADTYEDLFAVCRRLRLPASEIAEMYRRMVFNVMAGNMDDHNKNFSFMMDTDGIWHITPAYDMTFAIDLKAPAYVNRHTMTIGGKDHDITKDDLLGFAQLCGIRQAQSIINDVSYAVSHVSDFASQAGVEPDWTANIRQTLFSE